MSSNGGALREVMHGTIFDGRVEVSKVGGRRHVFGIGARDKLRGEILVFDGAVWVAEVDEKDRISVRKASSSDKAVFLAIARVPQWVAVRIDHDIPADQFDRFIEQAVKRHGLGMVETVPFTIEGSFAELKLHVLNGECPFAEVKSKVPGAGPPHRETLGAVQGKMVGFYAEDGAGRITHHSTRTHVHVLAKKGKQNVLGHVDETMIKAGSILRLPKLDARRGK